MLTASGLKPSELFLCATHTHSAPALGLDSQKSHSNNVQYTQGLQGKLVKVVRQALQHLGPIEVGTGSGSSPSAPTGGRWSPTKRASRKSSLAVIQR